MNEKRLQEKQKTKNKMKLQDQPPLQYYGYFPAKAINEGLGVGKRHGHSSSLHMD